VSFGELQQLIYPGVATPLTDAQATANVIDHVSGALDEQAAQVTVALRLLMPNNRTFPPEEA
jgi:hypothetical protein